MKKIHCAPILRRSFSLMLTLAMLAGMLVLGSVQGLATASREPGYTTPLPAATFVVPEAVYLKGQLEGEETTVAWYINNTLTGVPATSTPNNATAHTPNTATGAAVYAIVPGATNLSLTLEVDGISHDFGDITNSTSGTSWTGLNLNAPNVTADVVFKAGAENTSTLMKWTLTASVDPAFYGMDTFTYINYSVIYTPMYVPSAYIIDVGSTRGGYQAVATLNGLHKNFSGAAKINEDITDTDPDFPKLLHLADKFDTGYMNYQTTVDSTTNSMANTAQQFRKIEPGTAAYGRYYETGTTSRTWLFGQDGDLTGSSPLYFQDRADPTATSAVAAGALRAYRLTNNSGELNVDISRYSQFGQIPNLYAASMRLAIRRNSTTAWAGSSTVYSHDATYTAYSTSNRTAHASATYATTGTAVGASTLLLSGFGTRSCTTANNLFAAVVIVGPHSTSGYQHTIQMPFDVKVNRTDKTIVRKNIFDAVRAMPANLRTAACDEALQAACLLTGSPQKLENLKSLDGVSYSPTGSALLALKDKRMAEHTPGLETDTATINYVNNATGGIFTKEMLTYHISDSITAGVQTGLVTAGIGSGTPGEAGYTEFSDDADFGNYTYTNLEDTDGVSSLDTTSTLDDAVMGANYIWNFYFDPIYNLAYDANGGTGAITPTTKIVFNAPGKIGQPAAATKFKRTGYAAVGWHTDPNAVPDDAVNTIEEIQDLIGGIEGGGTYTLFAIWKANPVIVKFTAGVTGMASPDDVTLFAGDAYGPLPIPERPGYTFLGWFAPDDTQVTETSIVPSVSTKLTAKWSEARTGTVTFKVSGGATLDTATKGIAYGTPYGALPVPARTGYDFDGWYKDNGTKITAESIVAQEGDLNLTARWVAQTYKVTFESCGGTAASGKTVTYSEAYGKLPTVKRAGYTFKGWYTAIAGGNNVTAESVVTKTADHKLYAQWTLEGSGSVVTDVTAPALVGEGTITVRYRSRLAIFPNEIRGQNLVWSSDSEFVTVDQNGNIESVKKYGKKDSAAVITATNAKGAVSLNVIVQPTIWQIIVTYLFLGWFWY